MDLSDEVLYEIPKLANDICRLSSELEARALWGPYERAAAGSALYIAQPDGQLGGHTLATDPLDEAVVRRVIGSLELG